MKDQLGNEYDGLETALADMPRQLDATPEAVLVVSGHWETPEFSVMANPSPPMLYDYYGFPEHTYRVGYTAPGSLSHARRAQQLLEDAGFAVRLDAERGFDHGAFVPLSVIYPKAGVPVFQVSLKAGLDPSTHFHAGRALAPLREENVLILGSGMSYHNLRLMGPAAREPSRRFDDWLQETLVKSSPAVRRDRLMSWSQAPAARIAHPREEHLIPLLVALGAADREPAKRVYHDERLLGGLVVSSYRFGDSRSAP
jgi:aromatic ring-opening dioxygenase catalytic subunit (LigB family)